MLEKAEPFIEYEASNPVMQIPTIPDELFLGDNDSFHSVVAPERRLYMEVFKTAFLDLVGGKGSLREDALMWFRGELKNVPITFLDVLDLFDFKASRIQKLNEYIDGSKEKPVGFRVRSRNEKSVIR